MPLVLDADEAAASADLERRLQADVRQLSDLALEYEVRQRLASIRNGAPSTDIRAQAEYDLLIENVDLILKQIVQLRCVGGFKKSPALDAQIDPTEAQQEHHQQQHQSKASLDYKTLAAHAQPAQGIVRLPARVDASAVPISPPRAPLTLVQKGVKKRKLASVAMLTQPAAGQGAEVAILTQPQKRKLASVAIVTEPEKRKLASVAIVTQPEPRRLASVAIVTEPDADQDAEAETGGVTEPNKDEVPAVQPTIEMPSILAPPVMPPLELSQDGFQMPGMTNDTLLGPLDNTQPDWLLAAASAGLLPGMNPYLPNPWLMGGALAPQQQFPMPWQGPADTAAGMSAYGSGQQGVQGAPWMHAAQAGMGGPMPGQYMPAVGPGFAAGLQGGAWPWDAMGAGLMPPVYMAGQPVSQPVPRLETQPMPQAATHAQEPVLGSSSQDLSFPARTALMGKLAWEAPHWAIIPSYDISDTPQLIQATNREFLQLHIDGKLQGHTLVVGVRKWTATLPAQYYRPLALLLDNMANNIPYHPLQAKQGVLKPPTAEWCIPPALRTVLSHARPASTPGAPRSALTAFPYWLIVKQYDEDGDLQLVNPAGCTAEEAAQLNLTSHTPVLPALGPTAQDAQLSPALFLPFGALQALLVGESEAK